MLSIYLHIPFCLHRCAYCDFNTYAGQQALIPAYCSALVDEIGMVSAGLNEKPVVHTIFFGGGTPSLLSPHLLSRALNALHRAFMVTSDAEITLEANPGTLTPQSLKALRGLGINRISLGMQSAVPQELRLLERQHDFHDVIQSVKWARQAGVDNLNLDLIYGLPGQAIDSWRITLERALDFDPCHLSLYALGIERGTPFGRWLQRGLIPAPDPDLAADMYNWAGEVLARHGFEQYEISNWSKPGFACRHNLQYWRNQPYLGFGAGAHGCSHNMRVANVKRIKTYINRIEQAEMAMPTNPAARQFPLSPAAISHLRLKPRAVMQETMLLGLRLVVEGVADEHFRARFGVGISEAFPVEINELLNLGLLEWTNPPSRAVRLTPHARLVGNQVFMRFVDS